MNCVEALVVEGQRRCYLWATKDAMGRTEKRESAEVFRITDKGETISEGMWIFNDDFPTRIFRGVRCGDKILTKYDDYIFPVSAGVGRHQAETWEFFSDGMLRPIDVRDVVDESSGNETTDDEEILVVKRRRV